MKGDIIVLATGRDPDVEVEILKSKAEGVRRVIRFEEGVPEDWEIVHKRPDGKSPEEIVVQGPGGQLYTVAVYLFDPETFQNRRQHGGTEYTVGAFLRPDLRPDV